MKRLNFSQCLRNFVFSLCLISLPLISVKAESKKEADSDSKKKIVFLDNFEPPGDDKPKDTGVGGSRDGLRCNADEQPIRALMPKGNYGLTFKQQPNIYLYLPQTSATQVVLAIQDEAGTTYARAFLPIEINSDIASFTLPAARMSLQAGKNYQWKISVVCGEYLKPGDPIFTGWVQRVEPTNTQKQLAANTNNEQIRSLGEHGYWYDMLDAISLRQRSANARFSPDELLQVLKSEFHFNQINKLDETLK